MEITSGGGGAVAARSDRATEHVDRLPQLLEKMKPHLLALNLNGMTKGGPKIMPLGQGERDLELLKIIRDSGWRGP